MTDSIWEDYGNDFVFKKMVKMLIHRGWIEETSYQQLIDSYNPEKEIDVIECLGTLPCGQIINRIKYSIQLNSDAIDVFKSDQFLKEEPNTRNIFVYNHENIGNIKLKFKNYDKPKESFAHLEIHSLKSFIIDLPSHMWGQSHVLVNRDLDIFKPNCLWDNRLLMTIYHSDPQARWIGARLGDIIKITTEDQIKYRKVIFGYGF